ncbi:hypothetical protein EGM70_05545 [Enterobacteriaceae bacterium 89]|nr:hypothetical protein [Enterobacteriaceae bacterium 89]
MYSQETKKVGGNNIAIANLANRHKREIKQGTCFIDNRSKSKSYAQHQSKMDDNHVTQRKVTVEFFLNSVVGYVDQLERYSHQGYPAFGKRTRGDVEDTKNKLISIYNSLDESEQLRWQNGEYSWKDVPSRFDHDLIFFHANNLHLEPLSSVSYQSGVSDYHQSHVAEVLDGEATSKRNYATLYYDIAVDFIRAGRPFTLNYSGSYAGRSGKYAVNSKLIAPAQQGFEAHQVVSTDYKEQHFETFVDNHERSLDSEVAIFEDLSQMISKDLKRRGIPHYETNGNINLFTDRATCNSCTALAMQFQNTWHVKVNVKHGGVDDGKGYI